MSTVEPNQTAHLQNNVKYVFNLFNIPQPYSTNNLNNNNNNVVTNERSPTPSVLSENSVECFISGHNMVSDAASSCSEESEELTNLTWLTELRNELLTWPDSVQPIADDDCSDRKCANGKVVLKTKSTEENSAPSQQKRPTASERYNTFLDKVKKDIIEYDLAADIYQKDVEEKPPFNYSHIIGMAMVENGRMTLQQICSWIESKFAFFRVRKRWNNSIRHNLSLHHCFKKIDRSKYEKGKGGYWELGIDPKKCDRKRIRNRKSSNRNRNRSIAEGGEGQNQANNEIIRTTIPNERVIENDNVEEFVLDELDVQQNVVIQKDTDMNSEFLTSIMLSSSQTTTIDDSCSRMCPYDLNRSIKLQDVFIANAGNDSDNNNYNKLSTSPNLSGDAEYELGTIIVNSAAADLGGVPGMNISDIEQQINVFVEDEIPEPCENVVISSYLSNGTIGNQSQPNVIVEQMEPYCTVSTSSESSFRPYIDGIDEAFQYLRSMDTRCDDLFDNLLDISASIFCLIFLTSLGANETTTLNGNPTHLKPLIVTNNNNAGISNDYNNSHQSSEADTTAQESIKIENRQLYDTVKHASGYDPDVNNNHNNNISHYASIKEIEESFNNNSSSSATMVPIIHSRKSAVIQAIPRKVRGPGRNTLSATATGMPFLKPSSSSLQPTIKDYGAGEPTTTIVYATSIPTSMPSRTFVNIRPVPLLSSQKYRSTVVVENDRANHHRDVENTKPVEEKQQYSDDEQQQQQQQESDDEEHHHQEQKLHVLKKTSLRDDSNSMQSTTAPSTQDAILHIADQQKRNPYKSILYSRIRTNNEEINDELPSSNRHTFHPNHKWTGEDYMQRGSQFVYENPDPRRDYYHPPMSPHTHPPVLNPHQTQTQNFFRPRYIETDSYQEEMYNTAFDPMTQQQTMHGLLAQQQQQQQQEQQRQQQQYQPLTVRDFDLLLQLLVLREQRLHAGHQDPFLSSALNDFNCRNNQQENSYYYPSTKALASSVQDYPNNFRSREPIKYMDNSLLRSQQQQQQQQQQLSTAKLLPSNVREELLFRMLLLALHLQPQTQPQPQPKQVSRIPTMLPQQNHHHNTYFGSPTSSSPPEPSSYHGFRHTHRTAALKNPVRSVQVLGEID